jgi:TfdA family taurine catabolism dioxygenase TauD
MAQGAAVWRGEKQQPPQWIMPLDEHDCRELIRSATALRGRPLDSIQRSEFPVPRVAVKLAGLSEVLERGAGFGMLRGLPVASVPEDVLQIIYWGIGTHLGVGVAQSAAGDRLGHVYDRGSSNDGRYYTRGGPLVFHMDPVDVVGLLCLRTARSGGASRIVSAGEVHNLVNAERPDLLDVLYRGFHNSRRGHGEATPSGRIPVFCRGGHGLECYLLPVTIQQATEEGYPLTALEEEALAFIEAVANRPGVYLDMDFQVGDIQFLSNRTILHARTDYTDFPDPARKRHLWRLWLMAPHWPPRPAVMSFHDRVDQAGGGVRG